MRRIAAFLAFTLVLAACGGGGGGGGGSTPLPAPSGLSYTTPVRAVVGTALTGVTPTVTGTVSTWSVTPALPSGLSLGSDGSIGGTPTAVSPATDYTIQASNASGNDTFVISLKVDPAAPSGFGYEDSKKNDITSAGIVATQGKLIDPITPVITGTVDSYSVNPALPAGLFLDTKSGTVSGTPRNVQVIAVYTITATNAGGSATFGLNVTVNAPPAVDSGIFRTRVQGMSYVSGAQSGTIGATGKFTYEVGQPITFSVGNTVIGTATPGPLLFPVDLVPGGNGTNQAVLNIDRFLQALDHDANATNGILIDPAVLTLANSWGAINFNVDEATFNGNVATIISNVHAADPGTPASMPAAATSQAHIKKVFQCAYSGGFIGEYAGNTANDDHGRFGATVKPDGAIEVFGNTLATPAGVGFDSLDVNAVQIDQPRTITIADIDPPFPFDGNFLSPDTMEGTWQNSTPPATPTQSGTFSGTRLGPSFDVLAGDPTTRHFTGNIELTADPNETATGIVVMDVGVSGAVTGFVYEFADGTLQTITGTLAGTSFTGMVGSTAATATLAPADVNHPNSDFLDGEFGTVSFFTDGCSLE
jgi:hypothetical protein